LQIDGRTILDRQRAVLTPRVAEVIISLAGPGPLAELGLRPVFDERSDAGPLAGVAAAFVASPRPWLLVVAGDMPHLVGAVLDALLAAAGDDVDAVVPRVGGYPEPLCALYGAGAQPVIEAHLARGERRTQSILAALRVAWLEEDVLRGLDPALATFTNVNEPAQVW
jgi:molybdopterin-guanine dinucleotide biosynthesis protein A